MKFLDQEREPLRRWLYGVAVAALALAVSLGLLTGEVAVAVGGIITAVLVVPAAEIARSKVSPERDFHLEHDDGEHLPDEDADFVDLDDEPAYSPRHLAP